MAVMKLAPRASLRVTLALDDTQRGFLVPIGVCVGSFANLVENQAAHLDDSHVQRGQRAIEGLGDMTFERYTGVALRHPFFSRIFQ